MQHPLAAFLAQMPGVADKLLARHVPDASGHCRGCYLPQGGLVRWPCSLYAAATAARAPRGPTMSWPLLGLAVVEIGAAAVLVWAVLDLWRTRRR